MRDPQFPIALLARALESVVIATAPAEASRHLAANADRDIAPAPYLAALWLLRAVAGHEASHAWFAIKQGWGISRVVLRSDGTGSVIVKGFGIDYDTQLCQIVFALCGPAYDLRATYSDVGAGASYDLLSARLQVDALNSREIGPPVSYERVAELAVTFVTEHIVAIQDIALALYDARELDQFSVDLFGRCRR